MQTIDERVARTVAATVVMTALLVLVSGWWFVLAALGADFVARAIGRPRWSPLAHLARRLVARSPQPPRPVAARPKRFAAGIGAVMSVAAVLVAIAGAGAVAAVILALLVGAAFLEAAFGFCVGCRLYALLAHAGIVADDCPECTDISSRIAAQRRG